MSCSIDHAPNTHDDIANAVAGLVSIAVSPYGNYDRAEAKEAAARRHPVCSSFAPVRASLAIDAVDGLFRPRNDEFSVPSLLDLLSHSHNSRYSERNQVLVLQGAGLRAGEIANLTSDQFTLRVQAP
jgi:hypothetical protein